MSKFINLSVIILIGFLGAQAHASKTISLRPNETKLFANNSLWTVNATCVVQSSQHSKSKIRISVLKNKGSVNGKNLSIGQATSVIVRDNSNISVSAEAGTQINLRNLGTSGLEAVCST